MRTFVATLFVLTLMIAAPMSTAQNAANPAPDAPGQLADLEARVAAIVAQILADPSGTIGEPCTPSVGCVKLPLYVDEDGDTMTGELYMDDGKKIGYIPSGPASQMSTISGDGADLFMPLNLSGIVTVNNNLTIVDGADLFFEGGTDLLTSGGAPQIGTTDVNPVELIVDNTPLLRLLPGVTVGNIAGGHTSNAIIGTSSGSSIMGGGHSAGASSPNKIIDAENAFVGAGRLNEVGTQLSVIGGGYANQIRGDSTSSSILGGQVNTIDAHFASAIVGGQGNTISGAWMNFIGAGADNLADGVYNFVGAGQDNIASGDSNAVVAGINNEGSGINSFVGGGRDNTVSQYNSVIVGGSCNTIHGDDSVIGGGGGNRGNTCAASPGHTINDNWGTIGGGSNNEAGYWPDLFTNTQIAATVGGGAGNHASGAYSAIAGGKDALASNYGSFAHASGSFANKGDAQMLRMVARGATTDTTPGELFLDGSGERMKIPTDTSWSYDGRAVAISSTGETKEWRLQGLIKNIGGVTTLVGDGSSDWYGDAGEVWTLTVSADDTNDSLKLAIVGDSTDPVRFVANLEIISASFP